VIVRTSEDLVALDFSKGGGLVPVVAQHATTGEVLMLGYADCAAVERTLAEGVLCFHSRSRERLWKKGETSGNELRVVALHTDCDGDALLARVVPAGPTCHTGARSCFGAPPTLLALADVIERRAEEPDGGGYTRALLRDANLRAKKLGEEAVELALACVAGDAAAAASEAADLVYHALVAARAAGAPLEAVLAVLEGRRGEDPEGAPPA
jgi:phosphoribosyl-ATP pyrophosphohydrolase/phosphoribosyl-AMP cyclohydrolase